MKKALYIIIVLAILTWLVTFIVQPKNIIVGNGTIWNDIYPVKILTPGKADTLNRDDLIKLYNGKTYSQSHRNVSESVKKQVFRNYNIYPKPGEDWEIDHYYPLCAGGSNDITNLWPERGNNVIVYYNNTGATTTLYIKDELKIDKNLNVSIKESKTGLNISYHTKDILEAEVCRRIKAGKLDPKVAFQKITNDWIRYYIELGLDKKVLLGGINSHEDSYDN